MAQTKVLGGLIEGAGTAWQDGLKTTNFNASSGEGYFVDTTSAVVVVTLPENPSIGDVVELADAGGNAGSNSIEITSTNNIEGSSDDKALTQNGESTRLVYSGATKGWVSTSTVKVSTAAPPLNVDYLVVGGGGAGGSGYRSGGGGAGAVRTSVADQGGGQTQGSQLTLSADTNYTVTVGTGGSANTENNGSDGAESTFATITSGGGGGGGGPYAADQDGSPSPSSGSGGGGGGYDGDPGEGGASGLYGYDGATGSSSSGGNQCGGGGGGAGQIGSTGGGSQGDGNGGNGVVVNIISADNATTYGVGEVISTDVYFGGGGGAGAYSGGSGSDSATGGNGGGGDGGYQYGTYTSGDAAIDNTGGGGGGSAGSSSENNLGGIGGSGVVIIKYPQEYHLTGDGISAYTFVDGTSKVSIFKNGSGTVSFSTTVPSSIDVDYLVVAGGASGAVRHGGGGGAGGLRTSYTNTSTLAGHTESSFSLIQGSLYDVVVGAGGASITYSSANVAGNNGTNSKFHTIESIGGGGGGSYNTPPTAVAKDGGSGGGGGNRSNGNTNAGQAVTSPVVHGHSGGLGYAGVGNSSYAPGGGGGAGAAGGDASSTIGGNGGDGIAVNILNATNAGTASVGEVVAQDVYYAGGAGGSVYAGGSGGSGGLGGGADGGNGSGSNGTPNTGGGGSGSNSTSGSGGSGVVILRYPSTVTLNASSGLSESTGSPFTEGSYKVSVLTSGTGTISFS